MTLYLWPYMDTIRVVLMNSPNFIYVAICFNYCMFISRKCLKAISSVNPPPPPPNPPQKKNKTTTTTTTTTKPFKRKNKSFWNHFLKLFLRTYIIIVYFISTTHVNLTHKVWANLINKWQEETHGLFGKKGEFNRINLLLGQWVHPRKNYNYLSLTQLLGFFCSVVHFNPLFEFYRKKLCWSIRGHYMYFSKKVIQRHI